MGEPVDTRQVCHPGVHCTPSGESGNVRSPCAAEGNSFMSLIDNIKRRNGIVVRTAKRFFDIDGLDQSGLLAIELFTTVIPLMLIGFAFMTRFDEMVNVGQMIVRQLNVGPPLDQTVISTFGDSADMKSVWTVAGLASFLVWGIPMSITVSNTFTRAWKHDPIPILQRIGRGALWFVCYLLLLLTMQKMFGAPRGINKGPRFLMSLVPSILFWSLTPVLLVKGTAHHGKRLLWAGLVSTLIDGVVLRIAGKIFFPLLLSGWEGFGPIGVAMTLMTWSAVVGTGWVVCACAGAIIVERQAEDDATADALNPMRYGEEPGLST